MSQEQFIQAMPKAEPSSKVSLVAKISFYPIIIWDAVNILTGLIGLIIYGSFTSVLGPVYVINQNIGVWLSLMMAFVACQNLYYVLRPFDTRLKIASLVFNLIYFGIMFLMSVVVFFGYAIYSVRADAIIWSIMILITCALNLYAVIIGWFSHMNPCIKLNDSKYDGATSYQLFGMDKKLTINSKLNGVFICGIIVNIVIRVIFIILMLLILAGAVNGAQIANYPMKGKIAKVALNDGSGRHQKIHYLCDGPIESTPVFIFEGDATHGYSDYYDIQQHLTKLGRRSCIYDKPGLGYSDYLFKDVKTNMDPFYHNFLKAIGEKTPYVMVAWGGGGSIVYRYAKQHPEMVKSLTFLDVFPEGIEFTSARALKNLTQAQFLEYKNNDLSGRSRLMSIINAFGIPWGLMSIFVGSTAQTTNKEEIAFWMKTEKTWITQSVALNGLLSNDFSKQEYDEPISASIPINLVISKHDDAWVIKNDWMCVAQGAASKDCQYQIAAFKYSLQAQVKIVKNLNGGSIIYCTDDLCNQGYYTFVNPKYTADTLNRLYAQ